MDEHAETAEIQPDSPAVLYVEGRHGGKIRAPFTSETAKEARSKRNGRPWRWEEHAARAVSRRLPSGERTGKVVLQALVTLALEGDVRAIELLFKVSGWRPETRKLIEHSERRTLIVSAQQPGSVKTQPELEPVVMCDSAPHATYDMLSDAGPASQPQVTGNADVMPSEPWDDGTAGEQAAQ